MYIRVLLVVVVYTLRVKRVRELERKVFYKKRIVPILAAIRIGTSDVG
jgi:hypothetical protein